MAVISNRNTQQTPMTQVGQTGAQVVKFIDAPRIYVKAIDSTPTPVIVKSNGSTPSGWTDLGIVDGKMKMTYDKTIKEVRTGIDQIFRSEYVGKKTLGFEFHLSQFDDVVLTQVSGLTASVITSGSIVQFAIGAEDVIQLAMLVVVENKLDGKEWQFYNPDTYIKFVYGDNGDETFVMVNADCPPFVIGGVTQFAVQTMFS